MPELLSADGMKLVYDDEGCGRPLLLVHGWATHAGFFSAQRRALAENFRIISIDMRGHGRSVMGRSVMGCSTLADGRPTMEALSADIVHLCRALDLRNTVAVGWSMGAMALWGALLTGAAPHIAGQVVVDMSPRILNGPDWSLGLKGSQPSVQSTRTEEAMRRDWPSLALRIAGRLFAEGLAEERQALERWCAAEIASADARAMSRLWTSLLAQDFRAALPEIATPALIAYGARSQLYSSETAQYLAANLPCARHHGFARSGHAPHLEEPEIFNRMLSDFAASLPSAEAAGASKQKSYKGRTTV